MLNACKMRDTAIGNWPFALGAVQIIANRATLLHRDPSGIQGMYDLLFTVGDYGEQAYVALPSLGVSIPYDSGTVVVLDAGSVEHGVPEVNGHRVCLAGFNRRETVKCWATDKAPHLLNKDRQLKPLELPTLTEISSLEEGHVAIWHIHNAVYT